VRTDEIVFDPAWHHVMALAVEHGVAGAVWAAPDQPAAQVARAAKFIGVTQVEAGSTCLLAMTYACVPALRLTPSVAERWEALVTAGVYDTRSVASGEKDGALIGMALTEKQGGSDVRASTTMAEPDAVTGEGWYRVTGEKWFVSAVHSDGMFVLAQTPEGVSCLLGPRRLDDGGPNGWTTDRLKDKLGNRSNPTAEENQQRLTTAAGGADWPRSGLQQEAHWFVAGSATDGRMGYGRRTRQEWLEPCAGDAYIRQPNQR
jgi:putative acyl-CoA dehydrogenase